MKFFICNVNVTFRWSLIFEKVFPQKNNNDNIGLEIWVFIKEIFKKKVTNYKIKWFKILSLILTFSFRVWKYKSSVYDSIYYDNSPLDIFIL